MNEFLDAVEIIKQGMAEMIDQYEAIKALRAENKIEQDKIIEQNRTIKHQIEDLNKSQGLVDDKNIQLNDREKQILIREKALINSNKMLDSKLEEFRDRNNELTLKEQTLQASQLKYNQDKANLDRQLLITKKLEETEDMRKTRLKNKEEEIDKELSRLRGI